jgi:hypothetical protein
MRKKHWAIQPDYKPTGSTPTKERSFMLRDYIQPVAPFVLIALLIVVGYFALDIIIDLVKRYVN